MHAKFYEGRPKKKPDFIHLKQAIILFAEHYTMYSTYVDVRKYTCTACSKNNDRLLQMKKVRGFFRSIF